MQQTTISIKDLRNLNKSTGKKRTYYDRFEDAIKYGFSFDKDIFYKKDNAYFFEFNNVTVLSLNDLFRINYKKSYTYRELWKERVDNLVSNNKLELLNSPVSIEILYKNKTQKSLDYDASIGVLKFIIDGFVKSKLINDDDQKNVPMILTKTINNKEYDFNSLIVVIQEIDSIDGFYTDNFNNLIKKEL